MAPDKPQSIRVSRPDTAVRGRGRITGVMLLMWWLGGYGLVAYGVVTERGPFAFLIDWQRVVFGGSNMMLGTLIGAVFVFWAPPWLARLYRWLRPGSMLAANVEQQISAASMSSSEVAARAQGRWERMDGAERRAAFRRQLNLSLRIAGIMLLVTWGLATWVSVSANADAGKPLTRLTVPTDHPVSLGAKSYWVHVAGATPLIEAIASRDYSIRGTNHRDYYTPLVPAGWHAGQRIYLVEEDNTIPRYNDAINRPDPPGAMEGKLSNGGPRPSIAELFRKNGYAVGDWTAVLGRQPLNGTIPGEEDGLGVCIWLIGGLFTAMFLMSAGISLYRRRKLLRQTT